MARARRLWLSIAVPLLLAASLAGAAPPAGAPAAASAFAKEGFVLIGEEQGVKVYRREKRPGIELAVEGNIAVSPERVRKALLDYPRHPKWQKHLKENRVITRGDAFLDVYQRLDLPILDDRDHTLHVTWGSEGDVLWTRFVAANERGPGPVKGVVRVTDEEGGWRLDPTDGGKGTHVVYRCWIDLAGSLPAWMGKRQATSDLLELFASLTKQLPGYP